MPKTPEPWSLTSLGEKLIKSGVKVGQPRFATSRSDLRESRLTRQMFRKLLSLIGRLQGRPLRP